MTMLFLIARRAALYRLPGGGRGRGGERVNSGVRREGGAGRRIAGEVVEHAVGQPGLAKAFDDAADGERCLWRRLCNYRAAGGQRRTDLPAVEIHRIVPGDDG